MRKFIFSFITMLMMAFVTVSAQSQSNYAGSSRFTDNWSVTLQGGVTTRMDNFFSGHVATTPMIVLGVDKYITPVFGVGLEGRTTIGTGCSQHNLHTAFDAVNVSAYGKMNLTNLFMKNASKRYMFEPVLYAGVGWGHTNCSDMPTISGNYSDGVMGVPTELYGVTLRNYVTCRAGVEFNFNLGKQRAWAVVVNPSVVWGNLDNMRLVKHNGHFEVTAGVVYHFKTSNGTHNFTRPRLYDESAVNALRETVEALNAAVEATKNAKVTNTEATVVETVVHDTVFVSPKVQFVRGTYRIAPTSMATIKDIASFIKTSDKNYDVLGFASVEGDETYNQKLSENRALAVKAALVTAGVNPDRLNAVGKGETEQFGSELEDNRVVIVESGK